MLPDGYRPTDATLTPLPGRSPNALLPARGFYTLQVYHVQFAEGALSDGENRTGCLSFDSWRTFSIVRGWRIEPSRTFSIVSTNHRADPA